MAIKCYQRDYNIYDSKTISDFRKNSLVFEEDEDTLTVKVNITKTDFFGRRWIFGDPVGELSYTFNKKECNGKAFQIYYGFMLDHKIGLGADELYKYVSREYSDNAGVQWFNLEVCFVYFEKDTNNIYAMTRRLQTMGGALVYELSEKELDQFYIDTLPKISPEFNDLFKKRTYKMELMQKVDIYNTIAYLEAQVDVLTRIILSNKAGHDENLIDSLEKADKYSVLNIKPREYVNQEFDAKKKMRELQEEYYLKVDSI